MNESEAHKIGGGAEPSSEFTIVSDFFVLDS